MTKRYGFYIVSLSLLAVLLLLALPLTAAGTEAKTDPSQLTLKRIFTDKEFEAESFGPAQWLDHTSGYTTLEDAVDGIGQKGKSKKGKSQKVEGQDIVHYHPETGRRTILVPAAQLVPGGETKPLEIAGYSWSAHGKQLLVFTNTARVWRRNTRGDYWIFNMKTRKLRKLGAFAEPSTLMFAKFSPDGTRIAYVCKNNIYVEHLEETGPDGKPKISALTSDGSETVINGTFDWVYEEELDLRDGFRWSPDGKHIAYWQLDASGIKTFYMINNTDTLYPELIPVQYPKVGTVNSACKVGVVSSAGGETRWFQLDGDPRNHYIARMDWADSSREIIMQRLNRRQDTIHVMMGDIGTGNLKIVLTEKDDAWVNEVDDLVWLDNGKYFTWTSPRDGWKHVYRVSRSGDDIQLLTPGDYDVVSIVNIDKKSGWLYFIASPDNPLQRYLYRVPLQGAKKGGKPHRVTPASMTGNHSYDFSPDGQWAFHTYSTFNDPPRKTLVRLPGHRVQRTLVENKTLRSKVEALKRQPVEFFWVDIGKNGGNKVMLDVFCMKPPDFNASKKYPVLFYVYGEPWGQTVQDRWGGATYLWHLYLTQQGYIVMSIDNRGTPAPRGREWRKCVFGQIGILASADQSAAVKAIIKSRSYVDPQRIGIWGWSGGGSMTLNLMFRHPDVYKTGISVAPVPDMKLYDTIYQERYMGQLKDNAEGYKNGSPITFAHQLEGNLLIIHGTGDDNVHYQGTERLINKLIEANKQFSMMAYPNRGHSIRRGKNTSRHLYELMTRYLRDHLKPRNR